MICRACIGNEGYDRDCAIENMKEIKNDSASKKCASQALPRPMLRKPKNKSEIKSDLVVAWATTTKRVAMIIQ